MATKSRAKSSSPTPLTTNDYYDVLDRLKRCGFPQKRWYELGLRLGLHKDTLDAIERDYPGYASRCFSNCLSKWLSRKGATYGSLSDALKSMNENAAADKLDQESLAKKTLKAPPLKATKSRSFSLSGRPPPLSKMTRSLSLATEPMALETKPHQPPLTKQKSVELTLQKTPSRTQQPPSTALQPSLNNAQQSPPTPTLKPQQQEEKKDPLPSLPIEGSIEFITVKEMLADLVSLLAGSDPVILSLNNELISCGIIPQDVYSAVANPYPTPNEKATRLINSLLTIIQTHSNPNSVFSSLITALQKVGLRNMASKLMEKLKMKGGHIGPNQQQPSVSEGPLQPVDDVTPQSHTPQPTTPGSQSSTPTTVIELSSKDEVATNIGHLQSCFATLDSKIRGEIAIKVQNGEAELIAIARNAAAYLKISVSSLKYGNVDELFDSLQPHYDFFSCGVLKHLTDTYLSNAQTELTQYIDSVDKFSESSQLKHIQSVINKEVPFLDSLTTKPIVIKLNGRWDKMTIKNFKSVLQYYFDPEIENLFSHISIKKGSVIITLLIPTSLSQSIIDTINNNRESMSRLGILEVAVDKKAFPIRKEDNNNFNASLLESVKAGDSFEVSMLLQLGADPNSKDERGKSAVEIANEEGHTQIKEEILAAGGGRRKSTAEIDEEEIEEKLSTERGQDYKWNEQKKDTVVPLKDPAFTKKMNKGYSIISIAQ